MEVDSEADRVEDSGADREDRWEADREDREGREDQWVDRRLRADRSGGGDTGDRTMADAIRLAVDVACRSL